MTVKASARSALIFAAGLFVSIAAPPSVMAAGTDADSAVAAKPESATSGKSARQASRSLKKRYAHRKHTRAASKSTESDKADEKDEKDEKQVADSGGSTPPAMPGWLANANAQMTAADAPPDSAKGMSAAMSEKANTVLQEAVDKPVDADATAADATVVAPDQLNDVDRALQEAPSTQTVAMASAKPASENPAQAANSESSTLDKTSLIGKVFIAFGALLTMASAARMFMA
jgi:hypothetical protein